MELAVGLIGVLVLLGLVLLLTAAATAQLRCTEAARAGARTAALGDDDTAVLAVARRAAGDGAEVDVLRADGSLDRAKLAGIVFSDETARQQLNEITHPLIHQHILAAERAALDARGPETIVVHDIPLLAEGQRAADFDAVIVVDVPADLQVSRLAGRGLPEDQARARMAAQATREQRLALANIVIDNSGTLDDLDRRVSEVWADLQARAKNGAVKNISR